VVPPLSQLLTTETVKSTYLRVRLSEPCSYHSTSRLAKTD
jgi:hypothetical protein